MDKLPFREIKGTPHYQNSTQRRKQMDYAARYIEWVDQNKDRLPKMYNSVDVHNAIWADERLTVEVKTGMTDAFRGPYEAELKHQKMLKWVKIAVVILVIVIAFAIVFPELFSW